MFSFICYTFLSYLFVVDILWHPASISWFHLIKTFWFCTPPKLVGEEIPAVPLVTSSAILLEKNPFQPVGVEMELSIIMPYLLKLRCGHTFRVGRSEISLPLMRLKNSRIGKDPEIWWIIFKEGRSVSLDFLSMKIESGDSQFFLPCEQSVCKAN